MINKLLIATLLMGLTWTSFGSVQAATVNTSADLSLLDQLVNEHVLPKPEENKLLLPSTEVAANTSNHGTKPAKIMSARKKDQVHTHPKLHKKSVVHQTTVTKKKPQTVVKKRHSRSRHLRNSATRCRWSSSTPSVKK